MAARTIARTLRTTALRITPPHLSQSLPLHLAPAGVADARRRAGLAARGRGMHGGVSDLLSKFAGRREFTGSQRPSVLGERREVPDAIECPDYARDGRPRTFGPPVGITVHSEEEIACAREAGRISREVLDAAGAAVREGITTDEIDAIVHRETIARGAYPSPLNYHGFPRSVCTSVNEVVCHGIPGTNITLSEGDIVNIDVSCYYLYSPPPPTASSPTRVLSLQFVEMGL
mmetsp:Transcript_22431/g.56075  ORF Transcript_22431/g.56075 Transcript_22431/m.56075 type:complete len:231 (-) Transcript_22431:821-1513(-)